MKWSWTLIVVSLASVTFGAGCGGEGGSKRKLVNVTGTVKFDGKPLKEGTVTFVSDGQGVINSAGEINSSGKYSLATHQTGDGVPPGSYKVRVESWEKRPTMGEKGLDPGTSAIPARYNDAATSGQTATVKDSPSSQVIDFSLTP